jgi:hypothetical protein
MFAQRSLWHEAQKSNCIPQSQFAGTPLNGTAKYILADDVEPKVHPPSTQLVRRYQQRLLVLYRAEICDMQQAQAGAVDATARGQDWPMIESDAEWDAHRGDTQRMGLTNHCIARRNNSISSGYGEAQRKAACWRHASAIADIRQTGDISARKMKQHRHAKQLFGDRRECALWNGP